MKKITLLIHILLTAQLAHAEPDCTCRHAGMDVPAGKTACIQTSSGSQMAVCTKVL